MFILYLYLIITIEIAFMDIRHNISYILDKTELIVIKKNFNIVYTSTNCLFSLLLKCTLTMSQANNALALLAFTH